MIIIERSLRTRTGNKRKISSYWIFVFKSYSKHFHKKACRQCYTRRKEYRNWGIVGYYEHRQIFSLLNYLLICPISIFSFCLFFGLFFAFNHLFFYYFLKTSNYFQYHFFLYNDICIYKLKLLMIRHCTSAYLQVRSLFHSVLYWTVLHCTVLYCTVLYCALLYFAKFRQLLNRLRSKKMIS